MEVQLSISRIYPSPIGIVDGLNLNKLFSGEHGIPPPTPTSVTAANAAGTHLATIANTMSSTVSGAAGLTSKTAASHADANQDEIMDYKDMPTDLRDQHTLKQHQIALPEIINLMLL